MGKDRYGRENLPEEQALSPEKVRYIIARLPGEETNRYYLCQDEVIKVGDMVKVSDKPEKIEVLAIIACDEASLSEMRIKQRVLWK